MVANAGTVKGKLILDTTDFTAKWKKILNDVNTSVRPKGLDSIKKQLSDVKEDAKQMASSTNSSLRKMENDFQSYFSKVKSTAQGASSSVKNSLNTINNTRFDKLNNNLDSVIRRMQNSSSSGVRAIGNKLETGLNSIKFDNLSTRFSATIQKMQSTASAGVKSISNSFSSMEAGINDIFATVAGGAGAYELFQYGMGRATTKQMLANKGNGADIYSQYQKYTVASSTADSDINRIMKYVMNSAPPGQTYRALNAIDSASYNSDPIQRQELLRNYGNYLSNGYSESLFRGDVTAQQAEILKNAETPAERIAAMEQIAQQQNTMGLSTTRTGPMGNYNKLLAASDTLMRGMADGLEKLLNTAAPLLDWFNGLDSGTQTFIGNLITFGAAITAVSGGVRILGSLLKPLGPAFSLVKKGVGKLGDITGVTDKLKEVKKSIKDAFSGAGETVGNHLKDVKTKITKGLDGASKTVSTQMGKVKTAITDKLGGLKEWIERRWNPTTSSNTNTTTPPNSSNTLTPLGTGLRLLGGGAVGAAVGTAMGYGAQKLGKLGGFGQDTIDFQSSIMSLLPGIGPSVEFGKVIGGKKFSARDMMASVMPGGSYLNSLYKGAGKGLDWFSKIGLPGMTSINKGNSDWLGKTLGGLLPGSASAAGKGGKKSISQDIFGKNGLLDFNRGGSGFKIPSFKWPNLGSLPGQLINGAKAKIGSFHWPNLGGLPGQTISWAKGKIGSFKWPNLGGLPGQVTSWAKGKIGSFKWPSLGGLPGQVTGWAKGKIGSFHWPSLSSLPGQIIDYAKSKIGSFHWPSGPSGMITGAVHNFKSNWNKMQAEKRAKQAQQTKTVITASKSPTTKAAIKKPWWQVITGVGGPAGPSTSERSLLDEIGSDLTYEGYEGSRKDPLKALLNGGNCFDMTMGLLNLFGGDMVWGRWGNQSHVWARIWGEDKDPARKAINNTWSPPPQGPGNDKKSFGAVVEKIIIQINAPVYGVDDLDAKIENGVIKGLNKYLA